MIKKLKLLSIDLDGTLLIKSSKLKLKKPSIEESVTSKSLEAISLFCSFGNQVIFSTGRNLSDTQKYAEYLEKKMNLKIPYLVCLNGALIIDRINNKIIERKIFSPSHLKLLVDFLEQRKINFFVQSSSYSLGKLDSFIEKVYVKKSFIVEKFINVNFNKKILAHFTDDVYSHECSKLTVILKRPISKKIKLELINHFGEHFTFFISGRYAVEVAPKNTNKFVGLNKICQLVSIDISESAAIGDQENDYLAIKNSGFGISVDVKNKKYLSHILNNSKWSTTNKNGYAVYNAIHYIEKKGLIHKNKD